METVQPAPDVGRHLADRRRQLGLSRRQVARRARLAERCVRQLEEEHVELPPALLWRLAAALETTPRQLLGTEALPVAGEPPAGDRNVTAGR